MLLAAALCSWQLGLGHVCLDLQAVLEQPMPVLSIPVGPWLQTLTLADWQAACVACPSLVAQPSAKPAAERTLHAIDDLALLVEQLRRSSGALGDSEEAMHYLAASRALLEMAAHRMKGAS